MTTKTINVKTKTISEPILNNNNNNISDNYLDYNFNSDFSYYENEKSEEETFDLYEYFQIYNEIFFENLLGCISLSWSSKMTSCAGVFSVYKGVPTIRLSESLLKFRTITEVKETLLHIKKIPDVRKALRKVRDTMIRFYVKGDISPYSTVVQYITGEKKITE